MMRFFESSPVFRLANIPRRATMPFLHYWSEIKIAASWMFSSREDTNFTYDISSDNRNHLAHFIANVVGTDIDRVRQVMDEFDADQLLVKHVIEASRARRSQRTDQRFSPGRRLGWYVIARLAKPRLVVETGVDKGLGSVILCSALLRNCSEGNPGRYFGTEINTLAGWMLSGTYSKVGSILYGDSIASLMKIEEPIDLFINDSDHSADYESREYEAITSKLSPSALVIGDNAHATDRLMRWSEATGRRFLFWSEKPAKHWYKGGGIGLSYPADRGCVEVSAAAYVKGSRVVHPA